MKKNLWRILFTAFTVFGLTVHAKAETITKPHTFRDGTPAYASEVNANFDAVYDKVNEICTVVTVDDANGRVGIGTTTPWNPLSVLAAGTETGGVTGFQEVVAGFRNNNAANNSAISIDAASGRDSILYLAEEGTRVWSLRNDADADDKFQLRSGSTPVLTADIIGNVGIGTTSPTGKLSVIGGSGTGGYFESSGSFGTFAVAGVASNTNPGTNYGGYFLASGSSGSGVYGVATNTGNYENYGGYFAAYGSTGRGVYGLAEGISGRGVHGLASYEGLVNNYGGYFEARGSYGTGVYGRAKVRGVEGYASDYERAYNYGGYFRASGSSGIGVYGSTYGSSGMGVYGLASDDGFVTNYGGYFEARGSTGRGVYGLAEGSAGRGISGHATGNSGRGVYGYAEGSSGIGVAASGVQYDFYAAGPGENYGYASSIRWKKNIEEIPDALDKVLNIRGVYFDWNEEHGGQHDMGFIAEEVGEQIPEIVVYEEDGVYASGMDYGAMTPMLVQAIKEQQVIIESQQERIEQLEEQQQQIVELRKMVEELQARL